MCVCVCVPAAADPGLELGFTEQICVNCQAKG